MARLHTEYCGTDAARFLRGGVCEIENDDRLFCRCTAAMVTEFVCIAGAVDAGTLHRSCSDSLHALYLDSDCPQGMNRELGVLPAARRRCVLMHRGRRGVALPTGSARPCGVS